MSIDLLLEKWLGTVRTFTPPAGDYEIFVNPSKSEYRDLMMDDGIRYTIDFRDKKIYVTSANVIHQDLWNVIPNLPDFDKYWSSYDGYRDMIYTGDFDGLRHSSDALFGPIHRPEELENLLKQDWKWVNRILPRGNDIPKIIKKQMDTLYRNGY